MPIGIPKSSPTKAISLRPFLPAVKLPAMDPPPKNAGSQDASPVRVCWSMLMQIEPPPNFNFFNSTSGSVTHQSLSKSPALISSLEGKSPVIIILSRPLLVSR